MREVGYRVHVRPEWVVPFIENYSGFFHAMEVAATEKFMNDVYIMSFVNFCKENEISKLSFQLLPKAFLDEKQCGETCDFLSNMECGSDATLIACFWGGGAKNDDFVHVISRSAKDNSLTLALRNIPVKRKFFEYLDELKKCANEHNFKVCLDFGILFYSAMLCHVSDDELISFFKNDLWWQENVIQIHVHDYNVNGYFLNFGDGYLGRDARPLKKLFECFEDECPIIFETTIQDIGTQGVIEVKEFFKSLEASETKI